MNRNISIVCKNVPSYSETFIQAHIERLPARVLFLHGPDYPRYLPNGDSILNKKPIASIFRRIRSRTLKLTEGFFLEKALMDLWRKNSIEAVLAEYGPTAVSVLHACDQLQIPLIVQFHGFDAYVEEVLEQYSYYGELFSKAAAIIAVSKDMVDQLLRLGAPQDKVFLNPCGVDTAVFRATQPEFNPPIFLAAGRFVDKKGPELTILAFAKVHARVPDTRLVMLGDGPLHEACRQLASALKIQDHVDFPGSVSPERVVQEMEGVRCFVQHSIRTGNGDSEGTPVAVLEAGACGLPVVATRHGGIRDAVIHEETGLLVEEGDIDSMAECMLQFASSPEYAAQIGKAARRRIADNYSMDISISRLWELIVSAIQKNHVRG